MLEKARSTYYWLSKNVFRKQIWNTDQHPNINRKRYPIPVFEGPEHYWYCQNKEDFHMKTGNNYYESNNSLMFLLSGTDVNFWPRFGLRVDVSWGYFMVICILHCLAKTWIYPTPYVCTKRIFDSRPFMYSKIFLKKTLIENGSSHLYASFGTFCA